MTIKLGINGFGRMGKMAFRQGWENPHIDIVAVNEIKGDVAGAALLLEYDSVHGRWAHDIEHTTDSMTVDGTQVAFTQASALADGPWANCDVVLECTGAFKRIEDMTPYTDMGVKSVIVSRPMPDPVPNIIYGVNDSVLGEAPALVSAASCTTNALAPVIKVLNAGLGIRHATMTTLHDATNTQTIIDKPASDVRRARSQSLSLIPTSTGSAKAIAKIFPELAGRINGIAVRVPMQNASLVDLVCEVERPTSIAEVNRLFCAASQGDLDGILGYSELPLVSQDYVNDQRSSIVDGLSTMVVDSTQVKVLAWYDNEVGYVQRMLELTLKVAEAFVPTNGTC